MYDDVVTVDEALLRLRRLWSPGRARLVDDEGTPVELSSVLVVEACARAGDREATVGDVAAFVDVAPSTASRLVDRAERAGLVRRLPSAHSARRTAVALTERGSGLRERAVQARIAWLRDCLQAWPANDVELLGDLLLRFAAAVEQGRPPGPPPAHESRR